MQLRGLTLLAATAVFATTVAIHADTINFQYSGTSVVSGLPGSSEGSGSFTFVGDPASLTLSSLTAFSFSQTTTVTVAPSVLLSLTFSYTLADLTSFSSTESGDTLLSLALTTAAVSYPGQIATPESFVVTSLQPGGAETYNDVGVELTSGQVFQPTAVTPEPSTFALLGTGLLGAVGAVRRRLA